MPPTFALTCHLHLLIWKLLFQASSLLLLLAPSKTKQWFQHQGAVGARSASLCLLPTY